MPKRVCWLALKIYILRRYTAMEKKTPLYDTHVKYGGKIVEFGGFLLPVQYGSGVKAEHMAVRTQCRDSQDIPQCAMKTAEPSTTSLYI